MSIKYLKLMETEDLEEIVACLQDSDRYLNESRKNRLIIRISRELVNRGHIQYLKQPMLEKVE